MEPEQGKSIKTESPNPLILIFPEFFGGDEGI